MKFEELVNTIKPKMKAIAHRLDGKYTMFSDEDLCQEALMHLWEKYNRGELGDKTLSFIIQGCSFDMRNYIRTHFRGVDRKSVSADAPVNEDGDTLIDIISDDSRNDFGEELADRSFRSELGKRLNTREMSVFGMLLEEMTLREIGDRLGISHVMVGKIKKKIIAKYKTLAI